MHSCWNCNSDPAETKILPMTGGGGPYEVDFTLGDISTRPLVVVLGKHVAGSICGPVVFCFQDQPVLWAAVAPRFGDASSVFVQLAEANLSSGVIGLDGAGDFTVYVF